MPVSRSAYRQPVAASSGYPDETNRPYLLNSTTLTYKDGSGNQQTQALTVNTGSGGEFDATTSDTTYTGVDFQCAVIPKAPRLVFKACVLELSTFYQALADVGAFTYSAQSDWALFEDCYFTNPSNGAGSTSLANTAFIARRCRIEGMENGFDVLKDVLIQDCLIFNLYNLGASHADGIQTSSGAGSNIQNITIRHNTIFSRGVSNDDGTSCVICAVGSTTFTDITIDDNVMAGGSYCIYGPQSTTGTRVAITNNKIWTRFNSQGGAFGPWVDATDEATVTGNTLGAFSGGYVGGAIVGTWSGAAIP